MALIVPEVDAAHLGAGGSFHAIEELELARDEWHSDAVQAEVKYGRPSGWDVSRIADLSELFQGTAQSCSGTPSVCSAKFYRVNAMNIEQWDTSRVTRIWMIG